jgi:hypothetical protein
MSQFHRDDRLQQSVEAFIDGALDENEVASLAQQLGESAEARELYARYAVLNALMEWELAQDATTRVDGVVRGDESVEIIGRAGGRDRKSSFARLRRRLLRSLEYLASPAPFSSFIALFILALAIFTAALIYPLAPGDDSGDESHVAQSHKSTVLAARIVETQNVRWADESELPVGGRFFVGETLRIASGRVGVELAGGVKSIVDGPAVVEFRSAGSVGLHRGSISSFVPPEGVGFSVATNLATVVDRGTEFGVRVEADGATFVHVLTGSVDVRRSSAADENGAPMQSLHAGMAMRIRSGQSEFVSPGEMEFASARVVGAPADYRRWREHREILMSDPRLAAYYDFEPDGLGDQRLVNRAKRTAGRFDGRLGEGNLPDTAPRWSIGRWPGLKSALRFRGDFGQRVVVDGFGDEPENREMALSAWVRPSSNRGYRMIASQWDNGRKNLFYLALREFGDEDYGGRGLPLRLRVSLDGTPGPIKTELNDGTLTSTDDGWFHVAMTFSAGGPIRLFKNGREIDAAPLTFNAEQFPPRAGVPLVVGGMTRNMTQCFDGWIDELAVFRTALTEADVRWLYESGKPELLSAFER